MKPFDSLRFRISERSARARAAGSGLRSLRVKGRAGFTLLEVLEHIPDAQAALAEAVRVCRRALLLSVPSRPDDNPEHIHLFDEDALRGMLALCGVTRVKCGGVPGHTTLLAHKE